MCVCVYVYRVHICRREAKLLLSEYIEPQCLYIDPGRPATYIHMQSCDVEAEPLTQYLRPLSLAAAPQSHSAKESDTEV